MDIKPGLTPGEKLEATLGANKNLKRDNIGCKMGGNIGCKTRCNIECKMGCNVGHKNGCYTNRKIGCKKRLNTRHN